jgi:hypothetical protein
VAIAALLACSLALAGPPMKAGAFSEGGAATERRAQAMHAAPGRPSAVAFGGRLQTPLAALPAHSAELAGLFVLGLSLLGAGRYLRREPAPRSGLHAVAQPTASEGTVPGSLVRRWTVRSSVR